MGPSTHQPLYRLGLHCELDALENERSSMTQWRSPRITKQQERLSSPQKNIRCAVGLGLKVGERLDVNAYFATV
jgi:hypothetical protein